MSLFGWLTGKKKTVATAHDSSGMQGVDKTRPLHPGRSQKAWVDAGDAQHAVNRKAERIERRELLYSVVRDTMMRVGVLSSRYKFKVLSLDQRGRQFLVMMDISPEVAGDNTRLSEIEVMLAQTAKARHDILVTSVYWRLNDRVSVGSPSGRGAPAVRPMEPAPAAAQGAARPSAPRYEPIEADEMAAFKKALAETGPYTAPAHAQAVHSGPRKPQSTGFENTEQPADYAESRPQSLSTTQYGDLE